MPLTLLHVDVLIGCGGGVVVGLFASSTLVLKGHLRWRCPLVVLPSRYHSLPPSHLLLQPRHHNDEPRDAVLHARVPPAQILAPAPPAPLRRPWWAHRRLGRRTASDHDYIYILNFSDRRWPWVHPSAAHWHALRPLPPRAAPAMAACVVRRQSRQRRAGTCTRGSRA
jgi:hypothetical protein